MTISCAVQMNDSMDVYHWKPSLSHRLYRPPAAHPCNFLVKLVKTISIGVISIRLLSLRTFCHRAFYAHSKMILCSPSHLHDAYLFWITFSMSESMVNPCSI